MQLNRLSTSQKVTKVMEDEDELPGYGQKSYVT